LDACVFGDVAILVLGDIEVCTDEHTLLAQEVLLAKIGKGNEFHGGV
jgi:hypothetical protein